ncbi:unnamed protein product [Pleuronectes platessa]|uniref:Uncharacterized protein n=1 Tax=Pleuronectes platessa TaxID=8262 RepID=A0A9N7TM86_PLEPL|nr:unnamed protein product [Pleuronectes platessa]
MDERLVSICLHLARWRERRMQTDNPPVQQTCHRESLGDSCQPCPELCRLRGLHQSSQLRASSHTEAGIALFEAKNNLGNKMQRARDNQNPRPNTGAARSQGSQLNC